LEQATLSDEELRAKCLSLRGGVLSYMAPKKLRFRQIPTTTTLLELVAEGRLDVCASRHPFKLPVTFFNPDLLK
jgi:hypothetical protein